MHPRRFVYVLKSLNDPGRYYTGLTSNVAERLVRSLLTLAEPEKVTV